MGPHSADLGPLEYTGLDDFDPQLLAARETFPHWDIYRAAWGYLAVPGSTTVYMASDVDGMIAKLRQQGQ
jgi:hypothetical protein